MQSLDINGDQSAQVGVINVLGMVITPLLLLCLISMKTTG